MQATHPTFSPRTSAMTRNLSWFLVVPTIAIVIASLLLAWFVISYTQNHSDRIYTGISVWGIDLSGMSKEEAREVLTTSISFPEEGSIVLVDPRTEEEWIRSPSDLGITLDLDSTVNAAFETGRQGGPIDRILQQFDSWYFGRPQAPIIIFNEGMLEQGIAEIAADINQPAADANLGFDGTNVSYSSAEVGRTLDVEDTRTRLSSAIENLRESQVQLLIHETQPRVYDTSEAAAEIQNIIGAPMNLYLQEPLDSVDLERVTVPTEQLARWIRVQATEDTQGRATSQVIVDENAVRSWLANYELILRRDPINARFYFDDDTRELVLVEPHVNGRTLNMDATVEQFIEQVMTPNRSMPFVIDEVVPSVNSNATATDLGIKELVSESTTWFRDSSNERKHNIARAAANFYGNVIAPGQEFSFNQYLGEVSAEMGYETGLIIFGGRTIEGIGGGVCQVSTGAFQAAFWAGFPIVERWEHGYRVPYYDDGEGPGMDATVYSPIVDFRFINDTPHYLLIENYYNEANSSLTFKFYSTSMGRTIVKDGPFIENVTAPKPDIWELDEDLQPGQVEQVDWAIEGADVTVGRSVFNTDGDLIREDIFVSNYVPWQNIYNYGPDTVLPDQGAPTEGSIES